MNNQATIAQFDPARPIDSMQLLPQTALIPVGAAAGPSLSVQMLDGFQVWIDDGPSLELPRGKALCAFKLLLLRRRRALSREKLCSMLWPDADLASARNGLNVTMHRLRRALGEPGLVQHTASGYQVIAPGGIWADTERFVSHATIGAAEDMQGRVGPAIEQYELAMNLYRNDLLDDPENEPALAIDAQALRDRLNQVLERLALLREEGGDIHNCLRASHRHLNLDECNEVVHRRLMRCYARLGQPQLAERQYRRCVYALKMHLGTQPNVQTTQLCRQIANHAFS